MRVSVSRSAASSGCDSAAAGRPHADLPGNAQSAIHAIPCGMRYASGRLPLPGRAHNSRHEFAAPQDPARRHRRHRRLQEPGPRASPHRTHGAEVQVVMSRGAQQFVTALTFQAVSGKPVRTDLWDESGGSGDGTHRARALGGRDRRRAGDCRVHRAACAWLCRRSADDAVSRDDRADHARARDESTDVGEPGHAGERAAF